MNAPNEPQHPIVILLVEDEPADAHLVEIALAETHVEADLYIVADGREALAYLRQEGPRFAHALRPHVILLDLNMPRMSGREFLAAIKEDIGLRDIPVVVLTTSDAERDVLASYHLGAAGFVTKPVDIAQFTETIRELGDYWLTQVRLPKRSY